MVQPEGYQSGVNDNLVCKLHKAIYGLKQAPRVWNEKLKSTLMNLGYIPTKSDSSLYIQCKQKKIAYILVYVDDIIITGNDSQVMDQTIKYLDQVFSIKDLGNLHHFIGIEVIQTSKSEMVLCQKSTY